MNLPLIIACIVIVLALIILPLIVSYKAEKKEKNNNKEWDKIKEYGNKINSILHNDYTCRIQTVNSEQNLELTNIIKSFKNILPNNPPILGNTSFNRAGEPLIHTIDDAITSLKSNFIEYLYFPEEEKILYSSNS